MQPWRVGLGGSAHFPLLNNREMGMGTDGQRWLLPKRQFYGFT